ncbi:hypothetical protein C7401_115141 [Paraburkholderia unamae]|uniref:hypothetical protein n=1 Tax=Paraburkholderia unamae TaxID=219649 RepID=UPI000DC2ECA2|nr:hypothetical protein [Paraburkholderia unamae]RAR57585.1 hypothetical protein C7401_115141 [Paraburkholderia unamae]
MTAVFRRRVRAASLVLACVFCGAWVGVLPSAGVQGAQQESCEPALAVQRVPLAQLEASLPEQPRLKLFEITDQPGLYVMHAPSLAVQGAMFSRIVALTERRDMPRDRVVTMNAVAVNAKRFGEDPAGLTAGNNFSTAQIANFFEVARRQHVRLTDGERSLQDTLVRWRLIREENGMWRAASKRDFLITIPATGTGPAGEVIDPAVRAAILSHELGHWRYFSDPDYAHACRTFWWHQLSYTERAALTQELAGMGYDPSDRIVIDELQAYLLHTPAPYMPLMDLPGAGGVDIAQVRRGLEQSVRNPQP